MKLHHFLTLIPALVSATFAYEFPRHNNVVTQAFAAEAAIIHGPRCPEQGRRAFVGCNPANAAYWNGGAELPAERIADLLQLNLRYGSGDTKNWLTNRSGSVIVFVARPSAERYVFTVFKQGFGKKKSIYTRTGCYEFATRALLPDFAATRLGDWELELTFTTPNRSTTITKLFSFHTPHDICRAFDAASELSDPGKDRVSH